MRTRHRVAAILCGLALAAALAYLPFLTLPFISDDYLQVHLARRYGPVSGWASLMADSLYRCRATSLVLTWWTERWFGLTPAVFLSSSLLLHIFNTWLVFALGWWKPIGWRLSAVAAAFFAVQQGHQEAVVWYAAVHEPLVFLFGVGSVLLWIGWLQGRRWCYPLALAAFALALFSKESAVALAPVFGLLAWHQRRSLRSAATALPQAAMAAVYAASIFLQQTGHLHFNDGTFSLAGPVWLTLPNSFARLFWIWGLFSLLVLRLSGQWDRWWPVVRAASIWMALTLLPYSFLTYMPRVPSRHTYLATAGLSLVVAAGLLAFREKARARWVTAALAAVIAVHQCGYLWTRKYAQFAERAEPTEALLRYARESAGPTRVHCFPYGMGLAQVALEVAAGTTLQEAPAAEDAFCMGEHEPPSTAAGGGN